MVADERFLALTAMVRAAMQRHQVPGVAVGILHQGRAASAGFGVTSIAHPLPVDADTLFQIGSITKTVTGTLMMQLVERGQLDLEAPVRTYLPRLQLADETVAASVRLRHLVSHVGGWLGDHFIDTGDGDDALTRYVESMAELPQLAPLGSIWSYNNAAFALAGRVIEQVTGQPYETVARQQLLDPLGMARAVFTAAEAISERVAVGHIRWPDGHQIARPWALARCVGPVGGLISSANDLLTYAAFHLGDDGGAGRGADGQPLLSAAALQQMREPLAIAGHAADATGVSWMLRDVGGAQVVEHGGATHGQTARLTLVPEHGFGLVVLTNDGRGAILHGEVCAWALEHYLGLTAPAPEVMPLTATELVPHTGLYTAVLSHVQVTVADDRLRLQVIPQGNFPLQGAPPGPTPPPMHAVFVNPGRISVVDTDQIGVRGEFLRGPDGRIAWLRFGGRLHARQG